MFLGACGLLSLIAIGINLITLIAPQTIRLLIRPGAPWAFMVVLVFAVFGLLAFGIGIATTIVFLIWLYYASSNLPAFGHAPAEIRYSPGWAIGSFFIPFVNLFVPFLAISELWQKSEIEDKPAASWQTGSILTTDWPQSSGPPPFFLMWWFSWITSGILANLVALNIFFQMTRTAAAAIGLLGGILRMVAAGLAIMVVREIDQRQMQASEKLPKISMGYPLPPLPPVFHDTVESKAEVGVAGSASDAFADRLANPDGVSN